MIHISLGLLDTLSFSSFQQFKLEVSIDDEHQFQTIMLSSVFRILLRFDK